jgi:integrase
VGQHNSDDAGRLPYDADDLKKLFSPEAIQARAEALRKGRPAEYWLPWLALYSGARLEELGQLGTADVRREEAEAGHDGVWYLAIEPGDGKRIKTRSSRRRVPVP